MPDAPPTRTLIVDDDEGMRYLLRRALERSGRFVVVGEASDGGTGIDAAAELEPELVLLDLFMPVIDGLKALPRIREVVPPSTVVVVVSSQPTPQAEDAVGEGGAAAVLKKPTRLAELVDDLLRVLDADVRLRAEERVAWRLPAELTSGTAVRRNLRDLAEDWALEAVLDELELLTTELVNNAVVHAGSTVDVVVRRRPDAVRVEVTDQGPGALELGDGALSDTSGRGLLLVEMISRDWGTSSTAAAKTVWFEVAVAS
jgi:DNA-binding NarL/FixJ family response regulator